MERGNPDPLSNRSVRKRQFPRFALLLFTVASCGVLVFAMPIVPSITVRNDRTGRIGASLPVKTGGLVALAYIHSANKGAVLDEFTVAEDGGLLLVRSVFQSFGAGMSDGLDPGLSMRLTKDGVELSGLNRKIGIVRMAVGTVANHRLRAGGREIALAERVGAGVYVRIAYERITLFEAVRERIRHGRESRS